MHGQFVKGRWQCGNVAKVLNNKTVRDWLTGLADADSGLIRSE
jgi:hypothetical protein